MSKKLRLHYIGCKKAFVLVPCGALHISDNELALGARPVDLPKWDEYLKQDSARIAGTCDFVESPAASEDSSDESADYSDSSSD